jgi:hypothetical protein
MVSLNNFTCDVMHLRFFSELSKRGLIVTKSLGGTLKIIFKLME